MIKINYKIYYQTVLVGTYSIDIDYPVTDYTIELYKNPQSLIPAVIKQFPEYKDVHTLITQYTNEE